MLVYLIGVTKMNNTEELVKTGLLALSRFQEGVGDMPLRPAPPLQDLESFPSVLNTSINKTYEDYTENDTKNLDAFKKEYKQQQKTIDLKSLETFHAKAEKERLGYLDALGIKTS